MHPFKEGNKYGRHVVAREKLPLRIKHKHIVELLEVDCHKIQGKDTLYEIWMIVMPYYPFVLPGYLQEKRPDFKNRLHLILQLCQAVHYLHARKSTMHRDLKPDNILLTEEGIVKLCDFSLAEKLSGPGHTLHHKVGTPGWMSPQLFLEVVKYHFPADVFALAHIIAAVVIWMPHQGCHVCKKLRIHNGNVTLSLLYQMDVHFSKLCNCSNN